MPKQVVDGELVETTQVAKASQDETAVATPPINHQRREPGDSLKEASINPGFAAFNDGP